MARDSRSWRVRVLVAVTTGMHRTKGTAATVAKNADRF
jgi:hypothetical protein